MLASLRADLGFLTRPAQIIRGYPRSALRPDLIAGLTVAVILLPQSIAYALIAGLPPQMGLYTAIIAALVGALWGSSNQLQTGPTNTASLLVLSSLLFVAKPGSPEFIAAAGLIALLVGTIPLGSRLGASGVISQLCFRLSHYWLYGWGRGVDHGQPVDTAAAPEFA